jgi:hypothetical protein
MSMVSSSASRESMEKAEPDCHKKRSSDCAMKAACSHKQQTVTTIDRQWSPEALAALHIPQAQSETVLLDRDVPLSAFLPPPFQPPRA